MAEKGERRHPTNHRTPAQERRKTRKQATPKEVKKRVLRNQARAKLKKAGVDVSGKVVDHKKPLRSGGTNARSNLRLSSRSKNAAHGSPAGGKATRKSRRTQHR